MVRLALTFLAILGWATWAQAQSDEDARENSSIIRFIEDELSTENQIIRLRGVDGLLASNARVAEITVADREGVWLTISQASIVWSRLALLEGRVKIDEMAAASIDIARAPLPEERAVTPEAQPLSLPDLPLSIEIGALAVPKVTLGEPLVGIAAELAVAGRLNLISGGIDTDITIDRQDGPGGRLALAASYTPQTRQLVLDFEAREPVGGLMATALGLEGKPSVELGLAGQGPADNLDLALKIATAGEDRITGRATVRPTEDGTAFDARLSGDLAPFVGPDMGVLIDGGSELAARGTLQSGGGLVIDAMRLASGVLRLEGGLATTPDGFLREAVLSGQYGDGTGPTPLPGAAGGSITGAQLAFRFGGSETWEASVTASDLTVGDFNAGIFEITGGGTLRGIDTPQARAISADISARLGDLSASDPALARAMGRDITFTARTDWQSGAPLALRNLALTGSDLDLTASGDITDLAFIGDISAKAARIDRFSALAGRKLSGGLALDLSGRLSPLEQSFDLSLDGTAEALRIGSDQADRLLAGRTELSGQITRDATGFQTRNLRLQNPQFRLFSDGLISSAEADFTFTARLNDLEELGLGASGQLDAEGRVEGQGGLLNVSASLALPQGEAIGRPLEGISAAFTGTLEDETLAGNLLGSGRLSGEAISLLGEVALRADGQSIRGFRLAVGQSAISGDILRGGDGLMTGDARLYAPDIAPIAALLLMEATGQVEADLTFARAETGQRIIANGFLDDVALGGATIGGGALTARIDNALGVPAISGTLRFNDALLGGVSIASGTLQADRAPGGGTEISLGANLPQASRLTARGELTETSDGYLVGLTDLRFANAEALVSLARPASLAVRGSNVTIERLTLTAGEGLLTVAGSIAETIQIDALIEDLPLSLVNALRPDIGLAGTLTGEAQIAGPRAAPDITANLAVAGLTSTALQAADLPPVAVTLAGESNSGRFNVEGRLTGPGDFAATVDGSLPMGEGDMALSGQLDRFPLALIDRLAGRQGLRGRVSGTFGVAGAYADPRLRFSISSPGITANPLASNGVAPIAVTAEGSFTDNRLTLASAALRNDGGLNLRGSGRIPLALDGLDLALRGQIPLRAVGFALARAGFRGDGVLNLGIRASGRLSDPTINGDASLAGATLLLPALNLRLNDVNAQADLAGERLVIRSATARNSGGGTVSTQGTVTLDPAAGFPADLSVSLRDFRYTDGRMASARLGGDLTITGPAARDGILGGTINVAQLEFRIPEAVASSDSYRLNIDHIALPSGVSRTLERARLAGPETPEERSEKGLRLDIRFNAPSRVFVRGRGLDAELGGEIRLGGTVRGLKPVGQFDLIRGRVVILGQRLELTTGGAVFDGDPLPVLNLKARTQVEDVEATVSVEGRANAPTVELSSVPDLPDDEILAQIIFRRAAADLSPLQIAQLAAALAELSGRGGIGFFEQVRSATGLDDLDFETSEDGATTVRAGKYLSDNLYSTLEADTRGGSRASIVLDLSDHLTARGTVDNTGATTFGIFFEKDY